MTDGSEEETTDRRGTDDEPTGADLVDLASRRLTVVDEVPLSVVRGGEVLVFGGLRLVPGGTDTSREVARTIAHAIEGCRGPGGRRVRGRHVRHAPRGSSRSRRRAQRAPAARVRARDVPRGAGTADRRAARASATPRSRTTRVPAEALQAIGWTVALACVLEIDTGSGCGSCASSPGINSIPRPRSRIRATPTIIRSSCTSNATCCRTSRTSATTRTSGWKASRTPIPPTWARSSRRGSRTGGCSAAPRGSRLPVLALLAVFFPIAAFSARSTNTLVHLFRLLAAGFAIEVVLVAVALAFVVVQLHDSLGSISWLSRALRDNDAPRGVAVGLAAAGGAGLITGHSGRAELTDLGGGAFYANCGTAGRSVDRVETRAGLPAGVRGPVAVLVGRARSGLGVARAALVRRARPARAHVPRTHRVARAHARRVGRRPRSPSIRAR